MARKNEAKKALLNAFGDRYIVHEHDGGYILYDKEGKSHRANYLFIGKFYLSTNYSKYSFQDRYYETVEGLIAAMKDWGKSLPFDVEIYNPIYRCNYQIECAIHDYLKSLGFEMSWHQCTNKYILKDSYGRDICSFIIEVQEDTTKGFIKYFVAEDRWIESAFNDLDSAIGSCNSMIASYYGILNSQLINLLNNLTNSRSSLMLDKTFDIKTLSLYTEDATQKTIQWLEEELKKLKEKIPS